MKHSDLHNHSVPSPTPDCWPTGATAPTLTSPHRSNPQLSANLQFSSSAFFPPTLLAGSGPLLGLGKLKRGREMENRELHEGLLWESICAKMLCHEALL